MGFKGRDVQVVTLKDGMCLVAACDSCGAVGEKEYDQVKVPPSVVGAEIARAVLLEVVAVGANPQMMTVEVAAEPDPTGTRILAGVQRTLKAEGFEGLPLIISTEKNMKTVQTGLGISVTGTCPEKELIVATSCPGDKVYVVGTPLVGEEVVQAAAGSLVNTHHIRSLLGADKVHDLVPVGSRGILAEANDLAKAVGTELQLDPAVTLDLKKAAGPSTCAIFTATDGWSCEDETALPQISHLGWFIVSG